MESTKNTFLYSFKKHQFGFPKLKVKNLYWCSHIFTYLVQRCSMEVNLFTGLISLLIHIHPPADSRPACRRVDLSSVLSGCNRFRRVPSSYATRRSSSSPIFTPLLPHILRLSTASQPLADGRPSCGGVSVTCLPVTMVTLQSWHSTLSVLCVLLLRWLKFFKNLTVSIFIVRMDLMPFLPYHTVLGVLSSVLNPISEYFF